MVLPGKITAQGWALAPIAVATRPQGAPLTVILRGKRMPGTEDGPGPVFAGAAIERSVTAGTADLRKRGSRPGGGGAPVRAPAREGATWPPPRSRTVAPSFPR